MQTDSVSLLATLCNQLPANSAKFRTALRIAMELLDGDSLLQLRASLEENGVISFSPAESTASLQAIFYDLDGTLLDSHPAIELAAQHAVTQFDPSLALPPLRPFIGPPIRKIFTAALGELGKNDLDSLESLYRQAYDGEFCLHSEPYDGVRSTLDFFRDLGIRQYVVTNKPSTATLRIIDHLRLSSFFEDILCPDSQVPRFPTKTDATRHLIQKHNLEPARVVFFGDSQDDALAAAGNGLHFIHAAYGYGRVVEERPDRILRCSDIRELVGLIDYLKLPLPQAAAA